MISDPNKLVTRNCAQCGESFTTERRYLLRGPRVGIYCSRECRSLGTRKRVDKICQTCGTAFQVPASQISARACSNKCRGVAQRTAKARICRNCGASFVIAPSQFKYYKGAGKYCSQKCSYDGMAKENALKPIKDKYGRSNRRADREWQRDVREKDNYTCQRCGIQESYIHAHHVAPRSQRPDLKHDVSNGKCLCNSCHSWVHNYPLEARALGLLSSETYERALKVLRGEGNPQSKLRDQDVITMRARFAEGEKIVAIAADYNLSRQHASLILHGRAWSHINENTCDNSK